MRKFLFLTLALVGISYAITGLHEKQSKILFEMTQEINDSKVKVIPFTSLNYNEIDPFEFNKKPKHYIINMATNNEITQIKIYTRYTPFNKHHFTKEINDHNYKYSLLVSEDSACVMNIGGKDKRKLLESKLNKSYIETLFFSKEEFYEENCPKVNRKV